MGLASVPRLWPGETFVCIGSGESLTQADVDFCRGKARVIAVNDNYLKAPWVDVLYACDEKWWRWHHGVPSFRGLKFSLTAKNRPDVVTLRQGPDAGLSLDPHILNTGRNSGYQAINLAVLLGAARIVLLGYDMQITKQTHWFGNHPDKRRPPVAVFLRYYPSLVKPLHKAGVEIINASRQTALKCFHRAPLDQALGLAVAA